MKYVPKAVKRLVKTLFYRPHGVHMGRDSFIKRPYWLDGRKRISIGARCSAGRFTIWVPLAHYGTVTQNGMIKLGDDVYIGGFSQLHALSTLEIGDGCALSEHVYISDVAHGLNPNAGPIMQQPLESKGPVRIGRRVFICFGVSVLPSVTLSDHCVVGTRSVVTRSFPSYSTIAGAPARLIKAFDQHSNMWVPATQD